MKIDVVLPAGGRIDGDFAAQTGTDVKALIEINGSTVLRRTLEMLRSCERFGRIVVVGPDEVIGQAAGGLADVVLPEGDSGPSNIFTGLEWIREAGGASAASRALILTTDLPFLTEQVLCGFLDACPEDTDLCAPLISRQSFMTRFPDSPSEFVSLNDGQWTMGCAFAVSLEGILANRGHIERIFAARKSKAAMARLLGLSFVLRYALGRLTVRQIEQRCRIILGCAAGAIQGAPELAFDLDNLQEYHYAVTGKGSINYE